MLKWNIVHLQRPMETKHISVARDVAARRRRGQVPEIFVCSNREKISKYRYECCNPDRIIGHTCNIKQMIYCYADKVPGVTGGQHIHHLKGPLKTLLLNLTGNGKPGGLRSTFDSNPSGPSPIIQEVD